MTVGELIYYLRQYDEDTEVRVAFQPSWPLRGTVQNVVADGEIEPDVGGDDREAAENFVWIAVDQVSSYSENPYAPAGAWR